MSKSHPHRSTYVHVYVSVEVPLIQRPRHRHETWFFARSRPLDITEVVELVPVVKPLPILSYARGTALFCRSRRKESTEGSRLRQLAAREFDRVLQVVEDAPTLAT